MTELGSVAAGVDRIGPVRRSVANGVPWGGGEGRGRQVGLVMAGRVT